LSQAGAIEPTDPLRGDLRADVAIVGGGYAGLWTALALKRRDPDARVAVLEAGACGEGPSGRNAGFVNTFWQYFDLLRDAHGPAAAIDLCDLAERSTDAIGDFAGDRDIDFHYRRGGHLKVATSAAQDDAWEEARRACEAHGRAAKLIDLGRPEVQERCGSPLFRGGALFPEAATVQPALLSRALRQAALDAGVRVAEHTRVRRLVSIDGGAVRIEVDGGGRVSAGTAILAINAATAAIAPLRSRLAVTSTHMIVTEPVPDVLDEIGWTGGECISTARRYLHYFRTTADGRIAFGWGGGRIAYGARLGGRVEVDPEMARVLGRDIVEFFPDLRGRRIDAAWGGPVDVSPNHVPGVGTIAGSSVHYVCGFTGNGVGPAHLAGEVLASVALGIDDEYSRSALVEPQQAPIPPEPLRYVGGRLVRAALMRKDALEDRDRPVDGTTRFLCELPSRLGIHLGR
jgi:glycine/D-amino acid oxidase-like deaminating enzyme